MARDLWSARRTRQEKKRSIAGKKTEGERDFLGKPKEMTNQGRKKVQF